MRSVLGWIAINVFFVAVNLVFAGGIYLLFKFGKAVAPELMESPLFVYPLGLVALAGAIAFAFWCMRLVPIFLRRFEGRERAREQARPAATTSPARTPGASGGESN